MGKLKKYIKAPSKIFIYLSDKNVFDFLSDRSYLSFMYRARLKKKLSLDKPKTFNEKLQWIKLNDRKPEYTTMVDKYAVRKYIADEIGEKYLIPLLGVWDDPDDIDFDKLPDQFVLKCNHNSGCGMCICKDKSALDKRLVLRELKKGLKEDYFKKNREWPYKNVSRKIIAEKYMTDESGEELKDYKLMCFNGKVRYTLVCSGRFNHDGITETFYDRDWKIADFRRPDTPVSGKPCKKPRSYEEMVVLAEKLSRNMMFARIDFYDINGRLYFGEITLFPASGMKGFEPEEWDEKLGDMLRLSNQEGSTN